MRTRRNDTSVTADTGAPAAIWARTPAQAPVAIRARAPAPAPAPVAIRAGHWHTYVCWLTTR